MIRMGVFFQPTGSMYFSGGCLVTWDSRNINYSMSHVDQALCSEGQIDPAL